MSPIRMSQIRASQIRATEISSNHRELHGAIFWTSCFYQTRVVFTAMFQLIVLEALEGPRVTPRNPEYWVLRLQKRVLRGTKKLFCGQRGQAQGLCVCDLHEMFSCPFPFKQFCFNKNVCSALTKATYFLLFCLVFFALCLARPNILLYLKFFQK